MRCFLQLLSMLCSPSSWKMGSLKAISWCAIIGKMPSSSSSFSCFDSLSPSLSHLYWKKLHFVVSFWQNCTTPPFGISLGWTSIILECIPKHKKGWDGSQVKIFPNPDHPLLAIFLTLRFWYSVCLFIFCLFLLHVVLILQKKNGPIYLKKNYFL